MDMEYDQFLETLQLEVEPNFNSDALQALWRDGKGDWEGAHDLAQEMSGAMGSWIHAYLHRKEGDQWNARYWYDLSGRSFPKYDLVEEFELLVLEALANQ